MGANPYRDRVRSVTQKEKQTDTQSRFNAARLKRLGDIHQRHDERIDAPASVFRTRYRFAGPVAFYNSELATEELI